MSPQDYLKFLAQTHNKIKESIEARQPVTAMKLLEQCQSAACDLGNKIEHKQGKNSEIIHVLQDYCELIYLINEQLWHEERVIPGKVYRYLNKSLKLIQDNITSDTEFLSQ